MARWLQLAGCLGAATLALSACVLTDPGRTSDAFASPIDEPAAPAIIGRLEGKSPDGALAPLPGAEVSVSGAEATATTNAEGEFVIPSKGIAEGWLTLRLSADGYGEAVRRILIDSDGRPTQVHVTLKPLEPVQVVTLPEPGEAPVVVEVGPMRLTVGAGDLADPSGAAAQGEVSFNLLAYDPIEDADAFPADLVGTEGGDTIIGMKTFGMLRIEVLQGDTKLNVAEGQQVDWTVQLSGALAETAAVMPPISLWLDEETGLWKPEGEAFYDAATGAFSAALPHFSFYNVDYVYCVDDGGGDSSTGVCGVSRTDTVTCVQVVAQDRFGNPLPDATVTRSEGNTDGGNCYNYGCPNENRESPMSTIRYTVRAKYPPNEDGQWFEIDEDYTPRCGLDIGGCDREQCDVLTVALDTCLPLGYPCNTSGECCSGDAPAECADTICVPLYQQ